LLKRPEGKTLEFERDLSECNEGPARERYVWLFVEVSVRAKRCSCSIGWQLK